MYKYRGTCTFIDKNVISGVLCAYKALEVWFPAKRADCDEQYGS